VRDWLEHEIAVSLGGIDRLASPRRLATCILQEAEAVYASVTGMYPVVNVFFELGREGANIVQGGLEAFRLADMLHHTRLFDMQTLLACLELVDQAFREIRKDVDATLFVLDRRGYCIVAAETRHSILSLWTQLLAAQQIKRREYTADANGAFTLPFSTSGAIPPTSIHMDGVVPDGASSQPAFGDCVAEK
jgi:hypothetical protein